MYLHDLLVERSSYALKDENPKFPSINEDIKVVCLVRKRRSHEEEKLHLEQKLLSKICIIDQDDIFDKFCLQGSLEDIINLLIECSNGLAFSSQPKVTLNSIAKQYIVNDAIWFNPKTYQTCAGWVINEFEKAIALIYYQSQQGNLTDNNSIQNEDLKKYWMQNADFKLKILNQIPQICKEFKNAPKKKNTKQEDILWAQLLMKKPMQTNDGQGGYDINNIIASLEINEKEINQLFENNNFDNIYCQPLERFSLLSSYCEKRILRMIRDQFKEKLVKDLQEIEGKEKKKTQDQKKKSKKQKKQKSKNENDSQKNLISNQDKCNSVEMNDKQDTTQDDVHCTECECNRHSNPCSDHKQIDFITADLHKKDTNILEPTKITELIQEIDRNENELSGQNDDEDNWVVITAPKRQRKKTQRKFASSQDLHLKKANPNTKSNQPTQITPTQKPKPQIINQFNYQQKDIEDKDKENFSNRNSLKNSSQETLSQQTLTPEKKEAISPQSENAEITKQNKVSQNPIQITVDENSIIKPLKHVIQIQELSLCQEELLLDNNNLNMNYSQNNLEFYKANNPDEIDTIIMNQARTLMIKKLDMDMREFNDLNLTKNQEILQMRRVIYDRISFVINQLFREFNSNVRLFGSCATGLALPESDIDIGITGFELFPSTQLNGPIQKIIDFLQKMKWVKNIRAITTSNMPLIKLQVDPTISFVDSSHVLVLPYIDLIPNSDEEIPSHLFSVDVSFFQYQGAKQNWHLGQISTELTLQWLSFYNELRPIVLLFKSLLKKRGLNDQYKGGISSFCIIQMVLAFLESCYQQNQASSIGYTTYKFLQFYGMEFDTQKTGINYKGFNQDPFFDLNEDDNQLQITIVSPITNEVISQASSFVQTILQDIKALYLATENEVTFFYEKLKYNKKKKGKKEERNLFQKELNKLGPLFSNTLYNKT
ncbi:unnamed protein product (macronuclear) [Paramecium tetraurelia]|uniref:Poly(A) RNA polymerase mitochondrial-like central palm domain-containing protein n=1 Tax=Paramecium tetraurelia TaxID=5888 RepID=A0C4T2_PARTE|nr:uncharacterized protein GSPATT00006298001 [Paramecium tetraurelia]CAK65799.1 unnamed protein product [Paramecium tetraurelia]|eukprot:XP_001433196.1 hypothetical protein (macronuclear) [Paramecium tetraurelia strain d4-2]